MSSEPTNQRGPIQAFGLGFHVEAGWVFAALPVETLSAGLETNIDEIRSAVTAIPPSAISTEPEWVKLARGLAYEAQVYNEKKAEELWEYSTPMTARDVSSPAYFPVSISVIVFRCSRVASAKSRSGRLWPTDSAASCSDETA